MKTLAYNPAVAREARISQAILDDPELLKAATDARLRQADLQAVVDAGARAETTSAEKGAVVGAAVGEGGASEAVDALAHALGDLRAGVRLAVIDATEAMAKKPNPKLAADVAAIQGARFASKARPRKAAAPATAPAGGTPEAPAKRPNYHASRSADSVLTEVERYTALLGSLKALAPWLKGRGIDAKSIGALRAQAKAVSVKKGTSVSAHAAAHLATADEHEAVAETHAAWAKVSPVLHRIARTNAKLAALLR